MDSKELLKMKNVIRNNHIFLTDENIKKVYDYTESLIAKPATKAKLACSDGLWRKPEEPPKDNREVILLTSLDVYRTRYIDGEWNMPGRHDQQINEEILGWADKP